MSRFLLWSLAAHAVVFLSYPGLPPAMLPVPAAAELLVALGPVEPSRSPLKSRSVQPAPATFPVMAAEPASVAAATPVPRPVRSRGAIPAARPARPSLAAQEQSAATTELSVNELRSRIRARLAPHFRYPRLARLRGWQGTVQVRLRVANNGRVLPLAVAHSSGYRLLDRHALRILGEIGRISAGNFGNTSRELDFSVIYRLLPGVL